MIKLKSLLRSHAVKQIKEKTDFQQIVVIFYDYSLLKNLILQEGLWKSEGEYYYRIDAEKPEKNINRHIHIAHKKNLRNKNKQVAWNESGKRHDKKTFDDNFEGLNVAKKIAKKELGLSDDIKLERIDNVSNDLITESINNNTPNQVIYKIISQ